MGRKFECASGDGSWIEVIPRGVRTGAETADVGVTVDLSPASLRELAHTILGSSCLDGGEGEPSLETTCSQDQDVSLSVEWCRERGLSLAIDDDHRLLVAWLGEDQRRMLARELMRGLAP